MITACPLDCYDACPIDFSDFKVKPIEYNGFLCRHMNRYEKYETIIKPRYRGKEITFNEAISKLKEILNSSKKDEILHYRGSGNFGLMQEVTDYFFANFGATLTDGSLCDGAGEAGIIQGRGSNKNMSIDEISKSEVVVFWGRNPYVTSPHLIPIIKNKKIIVIDPVKTQIAKEADLYIQIKPKGDLYLAMLLSRFLHIEDGCNIDFLDKYASEYEDYYELTQSIRILSTLKDIDVTLGQIGDFLSLIQNKKLAIVCGIGFQKYLDGADIMRCIDAFATMLGLFGKEGSGVSYLGNSKEGIVSPFNTKANRISKVDTKFENYKTVFIQGANPLSQMPDSNRVMKSIKRVENVIYFGLYENETSEVADLVIPAKSFLHKNDIRTSYSSNHILEMPKVSHSEYGISEYDLSAYLCSYYGIELENEEYYINYFKKFSMLNDSGLLEVKNREKIPYINGFDTESGEFEFLDEITLSLKSQEKHFYLITPKSKNSLNSQFKRECCVYLNSSLGYKENEEILISSEVGNIKLKVKLDDDVRDDCVLIYSGTQGVNKLTTSKHSYDAKSAIYQELTVSLESLDRL